MPNEISKKPVPCAYRRYTLASHGDSIRHADCVVLPSQHALFLHCDFDRLAQIKHLNATQSDTQCSMTEDLQVCTHSACC